MAMTVGSSFLHSLRLFVGGWRTRWARRAVWQRRLDRMAAKRRRSLSRRTSPQSWPFLIEPLESRVLLAADLAGVIQSAALPTPALEGAAGSAIVQVINQGNQASNKMEVGVYVSKDATLDASDWLVGVATSGGGVAAGKSKDFTVPFTISTQLDPGTYRLLAKVDHANATIENNEANNVAVGGTLTVAWQFGAVPGKPGQTSLTLRDADGTRATFSLTGLGTGEVVKNGALWDVRLTGTDTTTALTITTTTGGNGRLTLNEVTVAGALASFTAPTTDLVGALTINNGPLPVVTAGTIAGGIVTANAAPVAVADTASATENGPDIVIDVLANDTDANAGDTKTIVAVNAQGVQGTVSVAPDGKTLLYSVGQAFNSLKAGDIASDAFTYTMRDTAGATSTATVTVRIIGTNDGPVAVADSATTLERQAIAITVLANDTDPDAGDTLRLLSIDSTGATGSTASGSINGVPMVYYTPRTQPLRPGDTTTDQFRYTVVDGAGAQSTATVTVTIVGINDAPVAVNDSVTVSEDTGAMTVNVLANDTDPDAGDTKTVIAADGNGRPAQIVITSHPSQEVTTFIVIPAVAAIRGSVSITPDGQGLVYDPTPALQSLRAGQTLTETIFYTMMDAAGAASSSTLVVTVTGANDAPTAVADQVTIGKNAAPVSITILANDTDPDAGDTKTLVALNTTGLQGTVTQAPNGSLIYTVGDAFLSLQVGETATETFSYTIQDSAGVQSTATVTVVIAGDNTAPVAVADMASATENGGPVTIDVLANDLDPDVGQSRSVIGLTNAGLQGTVSIAPGGTGVIYTIGQAFQQLRAGETVTEQFAYTMADAFGAQSSATVTVTVTGVNDGPVAVTDTASASEDSAPVTIDVLNNDLDADAGDTKQVLSLNTTGLRGTATISEDGHSVVYNVGNAFQSLRTSQTATERFSYTMQDGSGAVSTAAVTVIVTGANDAPVANADTLTVTEDAANVTLAVLTNDTDADAGDTKTIVSVNGAGLAGTVSVATNGSAVLYSAGAAFQSLIAGETATDTFTYTMRDGAGALSTATVTLTVTGVTDGPRAVGDTAVAQEDGGSIVIDVLANDTNDANPNDPFTITSIDGAGRLPTFRTGFFDGAVQIIGINPGFPRLLGNATIAPDGRSLIYTAPQSLNAGESLVDTFTYTMTGTNGGVSTAVVSVTVTGGANDAPTAVNDSTSASADATPVVINVLANDTDPDTRIDPVRPPASDLDFLLVDPTPADTPDTKAVVAVNTEGLQGAVAIAAGGGSVTYTAGGSLLNLAFGQTATETFTYTMQDGLGLQSTASVTVTVTGTNQAPIAAADSATAVENGAPVTIDVLANDSDADVASGDSFSIVGINTAGLQGTASIQGGSIVYTVGNAFQSLKVGGAATETFHYTIRDNRGAQSTGTVTVTVTGVNDGPVANHDGLTISEDAPALTLSVLANDTDLDAGDTKTIVSLDTAGLQGTATISADGSNVIYDIGQAFQYLESGVAFDTFTYTMRDSSGALSTARVTVTVFGAPEAPPAGAIMGTAGDDIITTGAANDAIYGQAGDDTISSGGGADTVFGGAGRDTIDGGDGNDVLSGGSDRDDLTGGLGADIFAYAQVSDSTTLAMDRIKDFSVAQGDKIDLRQIDANTSINGDNAFVISTGLTGLAGQLVLTQVNGGYLVKGDVNGDGVVDFQIDVRTSDILSAGSFQL